MNKMICEEHLAVECAFLIKTAKNILKNDTNISQACFDIHRTLWTSDEIREQWPNHDIDMSDYYFLKGVDDKLASLPKYELKEKCTIEQLEWSDKEEQEILKYYMERILRCCKNIISVYEKIPISPDIHLKLILNEIEDYKLKHQTNLDSLTNKQIGLEELNTKLKEVSSNISHVINDNTLKPQTLINILETIESYTVFLEDERSKRQIEIMFFKNILDTLSHIKQDDPNYRYVSLFKNNLGPASEELCERNDAFWKKVMKPESNL